MTRNAETVASIRALFQRLELQDIPQRVDLLQGGYLNSVYLVETDIRKLVLKFFAEPIKGTLFPNLPADEAAASRLLAPLYVAPNLIGYWPDAQVMASAYVEGGTWDGDMSAVAALLLRKEAADPVGFRHVPLTPRDILTEGDRLFARSDLPAPARPVPIDLPPPVRLSLIHTDIGASNLIGQGDGLRLIDWQCPAAGDLCEDIYSFLSPAFQILSQRTPFSLQDRQQFFSSLNLPAVEVRYHQLEPFFAWRMAGYCGLRASTHADADVRARYRRALDAETFLILDRANAD